jgi:hypothetical protein
MYTVQRWSCVTGIRPLYEPKEGHMAKLTLSDIKLTALASCAG